MSITERILSLSYVELFFGIFLVLGGVWLIYLVYRFHTSPTTKFDVEDLVLGPDDKASITKFAQLGAFFLSSWGFVYLTMDDKLTEWYYLTYMGVWGGSALANKWIVNKSEESKKPA